MSEINVFESIERVDQYIYHYTSLQKGLEYILPDMKLRLSPLTDVNDPRESKNLILQIPDLCDYKDEEDDKPLDAATYTTIFLKQLQKEHKILCFSRDSKDIFGVEDKFKSIYRGYNKPTLWAHYADNHKGMCLIFDKEKIINDVRSEFGTLGKHKIYNKNIVEYTTLENILTKFCIKYDDYKKFGPEVWLQDYFKINYPALLFTKTLDWKVENEFRIIIKDESTKNYLYVPIKDSLCGIVLGADFPVAYQKLIKLYGVPCGRLGWFSGIPYIRFRLV